MRLLLTSMPWAIFNRPSLQLGSLKGYLRQQTPQTVVDLSHPYLSAAKTIGLKPYRILSENPWAAEALYYALLFPERKENAGRVYKKSLEPEIFNGLPEFDTLVQQLDSHLDQWLDSIPFDQYQLVGFTVCFSQLPATLLAAKRIKAKFPETKIVLGGSTCSPQIGRSLLETFQDIDFVINGEGEQPLFGLLRFLAGESDQLGENIQYRAPKNTKQAQQATLHNNEIRDLNTLPLPDYDEYFQELQKSGLAFIPSLPVEFSRGCWWNKCTFCNLNLQWCGYRAKKSERMLKEVALLTDKYRCVDFFFTDNSLPPKEADIFFTETSRSGKDLRFFGEIRSIIKPETYFLYQKGGLRSIQIGIEAFSNTLLKRMQKGVRVIDNIAAIKFASEANIKLDGNLILEFPGSTEEEVQETCRALDFVLPYRPLAAAGFFLGHGSPVDQNPKKYGLSAITQHPYNRLLFPKKILRNVQMLIQSYRGDRQYQQKLWQPVRDKIKLWHDFHAARPGLRPPLTYRDGGSFIIIRQERPDGDTLHHRLQGLSRKIYLACYRPVAIKTLLTNFNSVTEKQLLHFLTDLQQKHLLFQDEDLYLALAVRDQ